MDIRNPAADLRGDIRNASDLRADIRNPVDFRDVRSQADLRQQNDFRQQGDFRNQEELRNPNDLRNQAEDLRNNTEHRNQMDLRNPMEVSEDLNLIPGSGFRFGNLDLREPDVSMNIAKGKPGDRIPSSKSSDVHSSIVIPYSPFESKESVTKSVVDSKSLSFPFSHESKTIGFPFSSSISLMPFSARYNVNNGQHVVDADFSNNNTSNGQITCDEAETKETVSV